jgi:hypothetical protein
LKENTSSFKYILVIMLIPILGCSPKMSANISSEEALEIVWPYRFRNDADTTEILEFRGVNLFSYSKGDRRSGWHKAIGFYGFKGDTILLSRMSDKQLKEYSKYDSSYVVLSLLAERRESVEKNRSKEDMLLEKMLSKEFSETLEGEYTRYEDYNDVFTSHIGFREVTLDDITWIIRNRSTILKMDKKKNTIDTFRKEEKETKKR